jgi:hypothetical protein
MKQTTLHSALRQRVKEVIFNHIEENYYDELVSEGDTVEDIESRIDRMDDVDLIQYLIQIIEEEV